MNDAMQATARNTDATHTQPQPAPGITFRVEDARALRQWAACLATFNDEAKVTIGYSEIKSQNVDAAHVALEKTALPRDSCHAWDVDAPGEIGLNVKKLKSVADSFSLGEPATVELRENETTLRQGRISRTIPNLDPSAFPDPKVPNMPLSAQAHLPDIQELRRFLKTVGKETSDHVTVRVTAKTLEIVGVGDLENTDLYKANGDHAKASAPEGTKESMYSIEYLDNALQPVREMEKCSDLTARVEIANDYPAKITAENEHLRATYIIAPRIDGN